MKVYVVISGYDYESSSLEVVFDSPEKAETYVKERKEGKYPKLYGFDWIEYEEMEVL